MRVTVADIIILKKPKLRTYVGFKEEFFTEPYVTSYLKRGQRSLCAQLRAGCLLLAVEVGRYKGLPEEERVVEDEHHFVLYCPLYNDLILTLFEKAQAKA